MPRTSRKDRRVQRERAQRASDRGLPAIVPEVYKSPRRSQEQDSSLELQDLAAPNEAMDSSKPPKGWFSQWPLSLKVLSLATLILLGYGLWRTIKSSAGP